MQAIITKNGDDLEILDRRRLNNYSGLSLVAVAWANYAIVEVIQLSGVAGASVGG